ncbi:C39 family peptidase [Kribbella sp. NPDC051587]|uniref:C39 family peptidase n=1 Tax=Kribbella sp. NPDC051587 TaxID=3364119 RepID=UPI0037A22C6C
MPTAARGATLIVLGALLAQAPLTAFAYQPRDPELIRPATPAPSAEPTVAPPTVEPTTAEPTVASTTVATPPAAESWGELSQQVVDTSPSDLQAEDSATQAASMLRCFKLQEENYCLGLGFVDKLPTGAQVQETVTAPDVSADETDGVEQDIDTGDQTPQAFVAERAALPKDERVSVELDEMQAAWEGREKARALRLLDADSDSERSSTEATEAAPTPTPTPTATPTRTTPTTGPITPTPAPQPPVQVVKPPASSYIMKGFQTSQDKGYWCGPATFQSIDWADDKQKDTQGSWAKDLGSTTSGTGISAMVKQTNLKTDWDLAAGTYVVQNVSHWNTQKFFTVHQNHLGDGKPAPVIEHVQLLKRYFPYLAFNHSGHYQVGRGYNRAKGTIGIFEVFNERRFNSRGNVTDGPKNIPAAALFNATLANSFQNIGL